ncbi:hypothetical protein BHU72_04780 [Desulfuribacillus stibiiarsenatis]|uniref:Uncharacterized protein n=1 Tax=Desulfuribacillus stibiiarsenatis TaxID=1390249 RepID=A0A1E5L5U9_9FIRM|nr:hypothetical protein [Desulfuribacillus stibiiarsenatis]OEH85408.1 hypothetical protein BHU72_04780 [Desulfuribacillus stibiiarsenatis]
MKTLRKKLLLLIAIVTLSMTIVGCKEVPVVKVVDPTQEVVSNIVKYEAPERTIAPEPKEKTGVS